jgi:DNA-binding CsgD family transcriptional regulator
MIAEREGLPSLSAPEVDLRIGGGPVLQIAPSERYALQLVAQGAPTSQIGVILGLAPADIDPFLAALFARLGATSRADATRVASRQGFLMPLSNGAATDPFATKSDEDT